MKWSDRNFVKFVLRNLARHFVSASEATVHSYYAAAFHSFIGKSMPKQGQQMHAQMLLHGIRPNSFVASKMVAMYASSGDISSASCIYRSFDNPSRLLFNSIIRALSLYRYSEECLQVLSRMHRSSCRGDHFTYPFVLKSVADLEFIITGRCIHGLSRKDGLDSDMYVATALIDMYAKCGDLVDARKVFDEIPVRDVSSWNAMISGYMREGSCAHARVLFDEMPVRNIVSWTSMISGYTQSGHSDAALQLFDLMTMEDSTVKPNWVTVMSILPACENSSDLERGRRIHSFAREKGLDTHSSVQTALIAMYAKCGSLLDARSCFDGMNSTSRNSSSTWNAMITAYSSHGLGKEAVETFEAMIKSGSAAPDSITFTGLLSGCGHSGLVEQGLKYFEEMSSTHGVEKTREHYACVVDMLGRAGRVAEAYEVSDGMPMAAGASVWGSLLAASSRWNENVEAAEVAAEKLLELEPDNSGTYAMLSNMYAEAQMWEEVDGLRLFQRSRRVKKNPGSSWID